MLGLRLDSFNISIKAFKTVLIFLTFKGLTYAHLVKTSMTYFTFNKHLTFLFFEDNDPMSAKSAAQILSLNHEKAFINCCGSLVTIIPQFLAISLPLSFKILAEIVLLAKSLLTKDAAS